MAEGISPDASSDELIEGFFADSLSKVETVDLIGQILSAENFYDSAWDEFEAIFQRVVWVFEDKWIVTFAPREGLFVQHLQEKWDGTGQEKADVASALASFSGRMEFKDASNGFKISDSADGTPSPEEIVRVVDALASVHGEPTLHLPWTDILERISDNIEETLEDEWDEETMRSYKFMYRLYETPVLPSSAWKTERAYSDDLLSSHSAHARFYSFLDELEDRQWIVINSECCGTCAGGSIRAAREENPSLADAPAFVVFEQNAEFAWGPSGWIQIMQSKDQRFDELVEAAETIGLKIEEDPDSDTIFYVTA